MTDTVFSQALVSCLPAAGYLMLVLGMLGFLKRVPVWVHPVFLTVGLIARVATDGWGDPALSVGVAAGVFVVLVLLAGGTVSGVTLFSLTVTLALTPFQGWPGLLVGLLTAAVVALVRTWRAMGSDRVAWLAMDTMGAVGVSPAGRLQKPSLDLVPGREVLTDVHERTEKAARLRMYLPPYLLVGVGVAAMILTYSG